MAQSNIKQKHTRSFDQSTSFIIMLLMIHQRGSRSVKEAPLMDMDCPRAAGTALAPLRSVPVTGTPSAVTVRPWPGTTKAGAAGAGSVMDRLLSMTTTDAMLGRRCGSSWTQSKPMWMHLSISCGRRPSSGHPSTSGCTLPRLHCFQTCPCGHVMHA